MMLTGKTELLGEKPRRSVNLSATISKGTDKASNSRFSW